MMRIKDLFPDASGSGRVLVLGELLLDFVTPICGCPSPARS